MKKTLVLVLVTVSLAASLGVCLGSQRFSRRAVKELTPVSSLSRSELDFLEGVLPAALAQPLNLIPPGIADNDLQGHVTG